MVLNSSYLRSYSQYAVNRPFATHASISAALPSMRIVRTFGIKKGSALNDIPMDSNAGGDPMAIIASPNDTSSLVLLQQRMTMPFIVAPRPRIAAYVSSRWGSRMTPTITFPDASATAIDGMHMGMPLTKFVVPSMGSTIHRYRWGTAPGALDEDEDDEGASRLRNLSSMAAALASFPGGTSSSPFSHHIEVHGCLRGERWKGRGRVSGKTNMESANTCTKHPHFFIIVSHRGNRDRETMPISSPESPCSCDACRFFSNDVHA